MATVLTIPHNVIDAGGIGESFVRSQGPVANVRIHTPWATRHELVKQLLGVWGVEPPFTYPFGNNLVCLDVPEIRPVGGTAGVVYVGAGTWPLHVTAELVAVFGYPPYDWPGVTGDLSGEPWITTAFDISGEMLSEPESSYYYEGTSTPVNDGRVGKFIGGIGIKMQRRWAPRLSPLRVLDYVGRVNKGPFTLGELVAPSETLLFLGGPMQGSINTNGQRTSDLEYNFAFRRVPNWNQAKHPKAGQGYKHIQKTAGSTNPDDRIYDRVDFSPLFNFA